MRSRLEAGRKNGHAAPGHLGAAFRTRGRQRLPAAARPGGQRKCPRRAAAAAPEATAARAVGRGRQVGIGRERVWAYGTWIGLVGDHGEAGSAGHSGVRDSSSACSAPTPATCRPPAVRSARHEPARPRGRACRAGGGSRCRAARHYNARGTGHRRPSWPCGKGRAARRRRLSGRGRRAPRVHHAPWVGPCAGLSGLSIAARPPDASRCRGTAHRGYPAEFRC